MTRDTDKTDNTVPLFDMQAIAEVVDTVINPHGPENRTLAFALIIAKFGDQEEGRIEFVSNADGESMCDLLTEYVKARRSHETHH